MNEMESEMRGALALLTAMAAIPMAAQASPYVWWEGEDVAETNFPDETYFSAKTFPETRDQLSEGEWLTNAGDREGDEAYAIYEVVVPQDGEYELWSRKFWRHGPFRWRFDDADWAICGRDIALADGVSLRTHLGANWVYLGDAALTRGAHRFELRLLAAPGESLTACFDAFLLTADPFVARGKLKPREKHGVADLGYFPYEPSVDPFEPSSVWDLSDLNEDTAGQDGFARRVEDRFELGGGDPVRFWGVNVNAGHAAQSRKTIRYMARRLAKFGVNIVRFHSAIFDDSVDPANVDEKKLDNLFFLIAALRDVGIYTNLSFYFPLWFDIRPDYGIPGYEEIDNKRPFALLYFEPRMQEIHRSWLRQALTTENPYTGRTLARESALAMVEIVNEDSFFFWTFTKRNVPEVHWRRLETMFADWLAKRYGSLGAALEAWGGETHEDDDINAGRMGVYEAWHMTGDGVSSGSDNKRKRVGDQTRFLTELQRGYYESTVAYIKDELGYGGLVSPSNWHVTDGAMLDALERYSYTAGDVIDRHGYFGGRHDGEGSGYSVRVDHEFESRSALRNPGGLPVQVFQIDGYPHMVSEIGWPQPNRFRAEMPAISAAYGALQGLDAFFFFALGNAHLFDNDMGKFQLGSPAIMGMFPAMALMYRRGDVSQGDDAIRQILRLEDLYAMKGSGAATPEALDELRKRDIPEGATLRRAVDRFDPLAYYVGRVARAFGDDPDASTQRDLSAYIDREAKTIRSVTGELFWDYRKGFATVNAPTAQGAYGWLADAGDITLGDVTIRSENEYGSVFVIALDDAPLAESRRILVQAATEDQPYGFATDGDKITALGGAPFGVKEIDGSVTLLCARAKEVRVTVLDENGYPTDAPTRFEDTTDGVTIRLPRRSLYAGIER